MKYKEKDKLINTNDKIFMFLCVGIVFYDTLKQKIYFLNSVMY